MSFATDYQTAYRILRTGEIDPAIGKALANEDNEVLRELRKRLGNVSLSQAIKKSRVRIFGRIHAAIYAFKLTKELPRQRILVQYLVAYANSKDPEVQEQPEQKQKTINLMPITVHRTTVQVRDAENND